MKKNNLKILLFYLSGTLVPIMGQQVITTAGNDDTDGKTKISWTVGELATETYSNSNLIVIQGQQQSNITITAIDQLDDLSFVIQVFPNPVSDLIKLSIEDNNLLDMSYKLFDISGRVIRQQMLYNSVTEIYLTELSSSIYLLKVYKDNIELKLFEIIKK
jgi:hypothetical protein